MVIQPSKNLLENPFGDTLSLNDMTPQWPIKSFKSYGEFGVGDKRHSGKHDGIDLGSEKGTPVYSMLPGIVKKVWKESKLWVEGDPKQGNAITIEHPDFGMETFYAHLNSVSVSIGEKVDKNTVIGTVGNSGNARDTKPHVHFETRQNGSPINPRNIMGKSLDDLMLSANKNKKLSLAINKLAEEEEKYIEGDPEMDSSWNPTSFPTSIDTIPFNYNKYLSIINHIETTISGFNSIFNMIIKHKPELKNQSIGDKNSAINILYEYPIKWGQDALYKLAWLKKMFPQNGIIENAYKTINDNLNIIIKVNTYNDKFIQKTKSTSFFDLINPDIADFSFDKRNTQAINAIILIKNKLNDFINEMNVFIETIYGTDEFDKKLKKFPKTKKIEARINILKNIIKYI